MDKTAPPSAYTLSAAEWAVLYLLFDALDQLRKMTLSFSELRYRAVEHTEQQIRAAVEALPRPNRPGCPGPEGTPPPLIVQIPNLADLPIYRISPYGRDLVQQQPGQAGGGTTTPRK